MSVKGKEGRRQWISLETRDETEAVNRAARIRELPDFQTKTGIARDVEDFLREKDDMKAYTRATMRVHGAALREFAKGCGATLSPAAVNAHYAKLRKRMKDASALIHMRALRSFFNWMVEKGRVARTPMKGMKLARVVQYARTLFCTKAQRDELIENAPDDDLLFILLCGFHAGMRKNEIIEARVDWFDLGEMAKADCGVVRVQNTESFRVKDREARFIPLSAPFAEFLKRYLAGRKARDFALKPRVKHGRNVYRYDFEKPFRNYTKAMGMKWVSAHVMRHTFASLLVQSGVSIFKVAAWLGDGVAVVEKHYAHLSPHDADIGKML